MLKRLFNFQRALQSRARSSDRICILLDFGIGKIFVGMKNPYLKFSVS